MCWVAPYREVRRGGPVAALEPVHRLVLGPPEQQRRHQVRRRIALQEPSAVQQAGRPGYAILVGFARTLPSQPSELEE
jgi:hypothetical protein